MKVTQTFYSGCQWCNARGFVTNPNMGLVTDTTITCPVCNGSKTVQVVEVIEDEKPLPSDLKKQLKDFNSWMCGKQYDGMIPMIDVCIDEYITERNKIKK